MIAAGGSFTCGVTDSDEAYCWGWNASGQIGNGDPGDQPAPVVVAGGLAFESVSAGSAHTCGVTVAGEGYCWGENADGELGNGTFDLSPTPVAVSGGLTFGSVEAGFNHSCGLTVSGDAYCWGNDAFGQLGNGATEVASQNEPFLVAGAASYSSVLGGAQYTCAIRLTGVSVCWGLNTSGQLGSDESLACSIQSGQGDPTPVACNHEPTEIMGSFSFTSIAPKTQHTCAVAGDGAYCWGWGEKGQLGNGLDGDRYLSIEPVRVLGQS
jgi:alpha-tubulin suppressor-like RCC1 family protein